MSEKQVFETLGLANYWHRYYVEPDTHLPFTLPGAYYFLGHDQRFYLYIGWKREAPYNVTNKLALNFVSLIETDHEQTYNEVHWSNPESEPTGARR
jgi:hypothetical protein